MKSWKGGLIGGAILLVIFILSFFVGKFIPLLLIMIPVILSILYRKFIGMAAGLFLGMPLLFLLQNENILISFFNMGKTLCTFFGSCGVSDLLWVNISSALALFAIFGFFIDLLIKK
ncbi:MAG: hypothetical protein NT076_04290 [Candidatus Pacearchaeota archaeon]|nr:hypothetical protein [Candidatus Pacearchaeota archaeon]